MSGSGSRRVLNPANLIDASRFEGKKRRTPQLPYLRNAFLVETRTTDGRRYLLCPGGGGGGDQRRPGTGPGGPDAARCWKRRLLAGFRHTQESFNEKTDDIIWRSRK